MPRIQFSDVVPPDKRSIRNVPIPNVSRRTRSTVESSKIAPLKKEILKDLDAVSIKYTKDDSSFNTPPPPQTPVPNKYYYDVNHPGVVAPKRKRKFLYGSIAFVVIISFVAAMMTVFASANVVITPKTEKLTVAMEISASSETNKSMGTLPYEVIKIVKEKSMPIEATREEMVERKASGKIMIYNNFSTKPERLIIRTRFESPNGLIYRLPESIVIPGKNANGPGQIEVEVFADEAGEKYNIGKVDFTIPGFKNDPTRFATFYARSSTEMSRGIIGKVKVLEERVRQGALSTLESELKAEAEKELPALIPDELVFIKNGIFYDFRELPQKDSGNTATLSKEVTTYALVFRRDTLDDFIIKNYLATSTAWQGIEAEIKNFGELAITQKPTMLGAKDVFNLRFEGNATAIAKVDKEVIKTALAGISRVSTSETMVKFKGIESIRAIIRPMWKKSFPDNPEKIYVDIE